MTDAENNTPQSNLESNKLFPNGFVKLDRAILNKRIWRDPQLFRLFSFILLSVKWTDDLYSDGHIKIPLAPGQMVASLSYLMNGTGLTKTQTHSKQMSLRKSNAIQTEVKQGLTVITLVNFSAYHGQKIGKKTEVKQNPNAIQTESKRNPGTSKEVKKLTTEEGKNVILPVAPKVPTGGSLIWTSYSRAYSRRYGQEPIRNAKGNSLCSQFLKRVGGEFATEVIDFYLTHNDRWYVQKCHALEYAVKDAEKLYMEWKNGRQMTSIQAKTVEQQGTNDEAFKEYFRGRTDGEKVF